LDATHLTNVARMRQYGDLNLAEKGLEKLPH